MAKVRVFEAAKQHGYEVQDLLDALVGIGVKVRSHLTPVDEAEVTKAMATLGGSKAPGAAEALAKPRTVVRRRRKTGDDESAAEDTTAASVGEEPAATTIELPTVEVAASGEPAEATAATQATVTEATAPTRDPEAQPESQQPPATAGEAPAEASHDATSADEPEAKEEFGLKVVRFIHPPVEETPTAAPAAATPSPYHMSKKEREARRAEKKVKGRKKGRRPEVETAAAPRRSMQKTQITVPKASKRKIRINEVIAVSDLSQRLGVKATELIKQLMALGVLVTINQTIDADTAALVAAEFDYEVENIVMGEEAILAQAEDKAEDLVLRSPVVTVMGHVDHGKTSLLDRIRETRVAAGEAGGITQHIGAYAVETNRGRVVFLDTPGHEAFTALRARGAQVTDITVLVVAANDGIMPQTVEAIAHSKAAGVPIIVAINKMDLPDANPDRVKRELTEHELAPEGWGGDVICVPLSAKTGEGVDNLLEMIALQSEILELKANPNKPAHGTVVEARVDRGRGVVATVLIQEGTLKVGDIALAGQHYGRVRLIFNDAGKRLKEAGPSTPVEVAGLSGVPVSGEPFVTVENERVAKDIASRRTVKAKADEQGKARKITLADFHQHLAAGAVQDLPIIIKADVHGSMEALSQSLAKLSTGEVKVNVIHSAVGGITENDVNLASASNAIIIGFNVRPEAKAAAMASEIGVDIRLYSVIYDASDDVKKAMEGLLAPTIEEKNIGRAEVRQIFRVPKAGTVAGCYVTQGVIQRNARVRLLRDNVVVFTGELDSLKRFKDDAKEVREGFECGLSIVNYNDIKEADTLEFFVLEEIRRTL